MCRLPSPAAVDANAPPKHRYEKGFVKRDSKGMGAGCEAIKDTIE